MLSAMIIFFNKITYEKKYLLWEYNNVTDVALCLYRTKDKEFNKVNINQIFEKSKYKGMTIELHDGIAIIRNVSTLKYKKFSDEGKVKRRASLNGSGSVVYSSNVNINNTNINNS
ncbi:MAG: hypothetical protein Q8M40_14025, partial [Legionella sp.]|nr:hypothetical protein [Legionella sp.]